MNSRIRALSSPVGPAYEALGSEIRLKRLKLGLSQTELAERLGLRRTHLSDLERGLHRPRPKTREKIDEFLTETEGRLAPRAPSH